MVLSRKVEYTLHSLSFVLVVYATYLVFMVVPNERLMGPVQRIFYFHVASAIACYCAVATLLIASLWHLATRGPQADILAHAAAEVGFLFCSITLFSGMIWGHSAWNTWFNPEPRLISFLILWLIFLGLSMLRVFGDQSRVAQHCAVLAVLSAITVPIVIYSIKFFPHLTQLHPVVIEKRGLRDPLFRYAWGVSTFALIALQGSLVWLRARVGLVQHLLLSEEENSGERA